MIYIIVFIVSILLFILPLVGFIYCIYKLNELSDQVQDLKIQQDDKKVTLHQPVQQNTQQESMSTETIQTQESNPEPIKSSNPDIFEKIFLWMKKNRLLKLGVLFILLGFGRFLSYMFINNRIGPVERIILGFSVGACSMVFGALRIQRNAIQGKLFRILGTALVMLTSYAGQTIYNMFDPLVSLGIVFVVSLYTSFFAMQYDDTTITGYGLLTGLLAPAIAQSTNNPKILFSYLAVMVIIGLIVVSIKKWKFVHIITLGGVALYALPYIAGLTKIYEPTQQFVLMVTYAMVIATYIVSVFIAIKDTDQTNELDFTTALLIGYIVVSTTVQFAIPDLHSILFLCRSLFLFLGGFIVFFLTEKHRFFYAYAIVAIAAIALATGIEFSGTRLIYAYTFLAAFISFVGYFITKKIVIGYGLTLLLVVPIVMALPSFFSPLWEQSVLHDSFYILAVVGFVCISLGMFYYRGMNGEKEDTSQENYYVILNSVGATFLLSLIRLGSKSLVSSSANAVMISLVVYTVLGLLTYFYGTLYTRNAIKYYGTAILLCVIARLAIVDIWDMDLIAKISTFLLIGILFISTVFIKKKQPIEKGTVPMPENELH